MIAITSISPRHRLGTEHQQACVDSWIAAGYKVVSLNKPSECEELKPLYKAVTFVPTDRHHEKLMGRPYVLVSAILDHAKTLKDEHFLIINSDIEIEANSAVTEKLIGLSETGITLLHRYNYPNNKADGVIYLGGMDGFFINKKWLHIFPQSLLCLGQCFWDFWVPYITVRSGEAKLYKINEPYLYHKSHPVQYNDKEWEYTGQIVRVENRLFNETKADKIAHVMRREFTNSTITA